MIKLTEEIKNIIYKEYITNDKSLTETGKVLGFTERITAKLANNIIIEGKRLVDFKRSKREEKMKDIINSEYILKEKPIEQIAKENKMDVCVIRRYLKIFKIQREKQSTYNKPYEKCVRKFGRDFLIRFLIQEEITIPELALKIGMTEQIIHHWTKQHEIGGETIAMIIHKRNLQRFTKEFLYDEYVINMKSGTQIAEESNTSVNNVYFWLEKYGIQTRYRRDLSKRLTKEILYRKYVIEKMSLEDIAKEFDCHFGVISKYIRKFNIPRKRVFNKFIQHGMITKQIWSGLIHSYKTRGLKFELTPEYIWDLFLKQNGCCALTGVKLTIGNKNKAFDTASLDRISSKLDYFEGNVQWVTKDINYLKKDFEEDELFNMVKQIYEYKNLKNK